MSSRSRSPESGERAPEAVLVGEVIAPHGVRGEVAVKVHSDVPGRFAPGSGVVGRFAGGALRRLEVVSARPHKGRQLVGFAGVESRDDAESLRGVLLEVPESEVPQAPEGHYYFFQLEGCRCIDRSRGEVGVVEEVAEGGGGVLLLVRGTDGRRIPVPFVEVVVTAVELEDRRILLELPEGLIEACGSA